MYGSSLSRLTEIRFRGILTHTISSTDSSSTVPMTKATSMINWLVEKECSSDTIGVWLCTTISRNGSSSQPYMMREKVTIAC